MASKFLVPLQLPELSAGTITSPGTGFVKVYINGGWLYKKDNTGTVLDLVLDRTLATYAVPATASAVTLSDTVVAAFGKLQKSLNSINLTGDVIGSASYVSGALTISATIAANSVTLGTDTVGDYVAGVDAVPSGGIEITGSGGEGSTPLVALKNHSNLSDNTVPLWDGGSGQLSDSPIQFNGSDIIINANFVVNGTTTTVNTETVLIADNIITLNSNYSGSAPTENAGIEVERGTLANVSIRWNESTDKWELTNNGSTFYTITTSNDSPNVIEGAGIDVSVVGNQVTVSHEDTSSAVSTNNSGTEYVQNVTIDTFGHVTALASAALKFITPVGDGVNTAFIVHHGKGEPVIAQVFETTNPGAQVDCEIISTTANDIQLIFAIRPQPGEYTVVII
jgi:hypothetical protein